MCRTAVKFVPQLLTNDEKQRHINMCLELREKANEDPTFTSRIIRVTKVGFMVTIQKQSNNRHSGRAHNHQEQKRGCSSGVQHAHCFFDVKGIAHREFVPPNITVNSNFYCDVLRCARENVHRNRPELWRIHN
jgi:hypothetical protein